MEEEHRQGRQPLSGAPSTGAAGILDLLKCRRVKLKPSGHSQPAEAGGVFSSRTTNT